jgi:hypothetical protein
MLCYTGKRVWRSAVSVPRFALFFMLTFNVYRLMLNGHAIPLSVFSVWRLAFRVLTFSYTCGDGIGRAVGPLGGLVITEGLTSLHTFRFTIIINAVNLHFTIYPFITGPAGKIRHM